jgi:hypothetical protein
MSLNEFSVNIIVNKKTIPSEDNGYVFLQDGDEYSISLTNRDNHCDCDAIIKIDDVTMGCFRVRSEKTVNIERPSNSNNLFKFVSETSSIVDEVYGSNAKQKRESSTNGIVSVVFKPGYESVSYAECETTVPNNIYNRKAKTRNAVKKDESSCGEKHEEYEEYEEGEEIDMYDEEEEDIVEENMQNGVVKKSMVKAGMTVLSDKLSEQKFVSADILKHDYSRMTTINLRLVTTQNKHMSLESIDQKPISNNSTPVPTKP